MTLQEQLTDATKLAAMSLALNDAVELLEFDLGWAANPNMLLRRIRNRVRLIKTKARQYEDDSLRTLRVIAIDCRDADEVGTVKRLEIKRGERLL